jgi:hypothetical protein
MKILDGALAHRHAAASTGPETPAGNGAKWQAQLQMAYLSEWREESAHAPSSAKHASAQPREAAPHTETSDNHHGATPAVNGTPIRVATQPLWETRADAQPSPEPGAEATLDGAGASVPSSPTLPPATLTDTDTVAVESVPTEPPPPQVRTPVRGPEAETPAPAQLAPPRYARQLMQVSLTEAPQVNLRDATLDAVASQAVALSIASELRQQGLALQRIFINGRRYDGAALTGRTTGPSSPTAKSIDQE